MSDTIINTLLEMGFSRVNVDRALSSTGSDSLETLTEFILSNNDVNVTTNDVNVTTTTTNTNLSDVDGAVVNNDTSLSSSSSVNKMTTNDNNLEEDGGGAVVKSIKCDDCGKLFKTNDEIQFHAAKSGHENFSESTEEKPLATAEEKKQQLAMIEAKLRQRRLDREAKEKEEEKLREKNRIKSGKELLEAKKKHEELEMKKLLEQRKREKEDEIRARNRVRAQIESDKIARKKKYDNVHQTVENNDLLLATPQSPPPPSPLPPPLSSSIKEGGVTPAPNPTSTNTNTTTTTKTNAISYENVKFQIRLTDGQILNQQFGAKEPLSAVRLFIEMNRRDGATGPFKLMTNFPRRVFEHDDFDRPLDTLGLGPAATLIVGKL